MSDQIEERKAKLERIRERGVDPYGWRFPDLTEIAAVRAAGEAREIADGEILEGDEVTFRVAGRVALLRVMGNLVFITLRDRTGALQIAVSKKSVGDEFKIIQKLLDLGDHVGVAGTLGKTKTGELTLWASQATLLAKAVRPPPDKRIGLTDVETRYRKRYIDLAANPESRAVFLTRAAIINSMRTELHARGFIEVETPVLQPLYGGAAARPFTTHHNTLDMQLYLRISPELYLKRCLVGGLERVYEFARCFRNEGISPRHNPEFTMLELYQAYGDYHDMMDLTETLIAGAARDVIGREKIMFGEQEIDYAGPWPRRKYRDLFEQHVGLKMDDLPALRQRAREVHIEENKLDDAVVINELFEHYVEEHLVNPTFVIDYPAPLCPLTRRDPGNPDVALRFELFVNRIEVANAYTELNDPAVQAETFSQQLRGEEGETMAVMDSDYVEALEYGMPPAGGLGIGIDRVIMLLTGSQSIRDVLLFPLQRPQQADPPEGD